MARAININADISEGFGAWQIGNDAALTPMIKSASIACGFHAGDWNSMHRMCLLARDAGVSIGVHPGFNDLWGFGRRQIRMNPDDLERMVAYQIGALQAMARYAGLPVTHLKPHGALNNMAAVEREYALAIGRAIKVVDPTIIYVAQVGTEMEKAALELGLPLAREGFADRRYEEDLTLTPRSVRDAVHKDPAKVAAQVLRMVKDGEVVARTGKVVKLTVDTICIHGDEPTAVAVATAVRQALDAAGIDVLTIPEMVRRRS